MSEKWPVVKLGEVLRKREEPAALNADQAYREITVRLWGKGTTLRGIAQGSQLLGSRRFVAHAGDLILSKIDARNGAIGLVPHELDQAVVTQDFPLFDHDQSRLKPEFLGWLTKTNTFVQLCKNASEGTTNRIRLKEERFLEMEISLPPVEEQRRIVDRIEEVASRVMMVKALQREQAKEAEALILSIHQALSAGNELVLSEILELHEEQERIVPTGSYPQVGVRSFGQGLFAKDAVAGTETTYRNFNRLYPGAIVLSQVKGWEGAISVCQDELAGKFVSPEYRTFRCRPGVALPEYLKFLLPTEWFWSRLGDATRGQGARRERTRPEQFLKLFLSLPSIEKQKIACKAFQNAISVTQHHAQVQQILEAVLPSFLDKAFRGDL